MARCNFPDCDNKSHGILCDTHEQDFDVICQEITRFAAIVAALAATFQACYPIQESTDLYKSLNEARSDLESLRRRYRVYLRLIGLKLD